MGNLKESAVYCWTNKPLKRRHCYDILLLVTLLNITVGLVALYGYIGNDGKWTVEPVRREKVLAIAVFLFLSACALCWFIMRKEQQLKCERQILIIDRPPSYETCVSCAEPPPPSYFAVVNAYHIV